MNRQHRTAIVTGAARGIGAATALRLAAAGMAIGVVDLEEEACAGIVEAIRTRGGQAVAVGADVSVEDAVTTAVEKVARELGNPTVLVNNAGITRDALLHKMSVDDWDAVMAVHLRGTFLMSRAVQKYMVEAGFGRIVNLSSTSALGNRGQANYAAAKAGLQALTKTLAIELGRFGVTANAIAPGFVETEMTTATARRMGIDFEELVKTVVARIPVGRSGKPEDIAGAVAFLAGEEAAYVSGQVLYVAGGPTV